jgi:SET family sugar efflux transporter-like MFS transporter
MSFTGGWIVGPVVGSWLGGLIGLRGLLLTVAGLTLVQIVPMVGIRSPRLALDGDMAKPERLNRRQLREMAPLFAFSALCMLALSGDALKFAFLPLYMENGLHVAPVVRGAVITTQPVFELLLIPVASAFARRFGGMRVMVVGGAFGGIAHLCYALSTNVTHLFLGQFVMSLLWACIAGLGVIIAQDLYRKGAGVATTTFLGVTMFSSTLGGLIGSIGVVPLGLPHVFFVPAIISAGAFGGLVSLNVVIRRREEGTGRSLS